eukprot:TRINITY_DN14238_c0_g1_i1.p1 TRINITY_DN14238_c0_g1~~TRINITY_DN14238_c0_g1_i1.p1  ORF type:complete len:109 (-),score=11.27 TRINITY_DN14238_c0_g1_i1:110-436(-)
MSFNRHNPDDVCHYIVEKLIEQGNSRVPASHLIQARNALCSTIPTTDNIDAQTACNYFLRNHGTYVEMLVKKGKSADEICSKLDYSRQPPASDKTKPKQHFHNEPSHE